MLFYHKSGFLIDYLYGFPTWIIYVEWSYPKGFQTPYGAINSSFIFLACSLKLPFKWVTSSKKESLTYVNAAVWVQC